MIPSTTLPEQQPEASGYNHPCGALLERGRRREYLDVCVTLYKASVVGDRRAARLILQGREYLVGYSITENKDTALHVAAASQSTELVRYLVDMMSKDDLKLKNEEGNTAFCLAAVAGKTRITKIMVKKNPELLTIRGSGNMMPLYMAVSTGSYNMVTYLYGKSKRMSSDDWTDDDRNRIFLKCIEADFCDVALQILEDNKDIQLPQEHHVWDVLNILARKPWMFVPKRHNIFQRTKISLVGKVGSLPEGAATHLLRKIWKIIVAKPKDDIDVILRGPMVEKDEIETYPCQILFIAAKMGNTKFLVELIREYPDLIWKINDDGQSIFHIAVFHRHQGIYGLLYELGPMRDTVTQLIDKDGNNMLHLVAMNPGRNRHEEVSGAAFQMQHECLWYLDVEFLIPARLREMKNAMGLTPFQVFTKNHEVLVSDGEKWMKETTNQSMVVATLITTIGFTAAFTIPGGYNQQNGFPMFLQNGPFMVFVIFIAISFISSSASILMFLTIIVSRYSIRDFMRSLPNRLVFGLTTLFLSIITLMVGFSASFFVLYDKKLAIIITLLVSIPLIFYAGIQANLLKGVFQATYGSMYHFKPKRPMIYYEISRFRLFIEDTFNAIC